jgi:hypothetical protein
LAVVSSTGPALPATHAAARTPACPWDLNSNPELTRFMQLWSGLTTRSGGWSSRGDRLTEACSGASDRSRLRVLHFSSWQRPVNDPKHSFIRPLLSVTYNVQHFLGPSHGHVQQVRPPTSPRTRSGVCVGCRTEDEYDRLRLTTLGGMNRAVPAPCPTPPDNTAGNSSSTVGLLPMAGSPG